MFSELQKHQITWAHDLVVTAVFEQFDDPVNLNDVVTAIEIDPLEFITEVLTALRNEVGNRVKDQGYCPKCLVKLQTKRRQECVGYQGSARALDWVGCNYCPDCGDEY
jgi:hypothetical protein